MSDFEINKAVAHVVYSDLDGRDFTCYLGERHLPEEGEMCIFYCGEMLDYCNNPSDAWPIIVENKIGITHGSVMCSAVALVTNEVIQVACEPSEILRAAMIVFLMMNEKE